MSINITQRKVDLDTPLTRGKESIKSVALRKPSAGELRGLQLADVLNLDVNALATLIPRISQPLITKPEVLTMDPADLVQLGSEISNFLVPKKMKVDQDDQTAIQASLTA